MFGCGDYIIPLFEAICYFYVQFCTGIVLNAEIYITFLTESHVGSFSYYNGADGGTKEMISYAREKGIEVIVGGETPPKVKEKAPASVIVRREYPLNLIDTIMDCETYQDS